MARQDQGNGKHIILDAGPGRSITRWPKEITMGLVTIEEACDFILLNWDKMTRDGGSSQSPNLPEFDLYARDFLGFAEAELNEYIKEKKPAALINCISHLKRAAECQTDIFLHVFSLYKLFIKRNLGFDRKLEFLNAAGVFSTRTLRRLNTLRNKVEHTYELPKVNDIEAYFDVVTAFVAVLESAILAFWGREYGIGEEDEKGIHNKSFSIEYDFEGPSIQVEWGPTKEKIGFCQDCEDIVAFARAFRLFALLAMEEVHASDSWVRNGVEEIQSNPPLEPIR